MSSVYVKHKRNENLFQVTTSCKNSNVDFFKIINFGLYKTFAIANSLLIESLEIIEQSNTNRCKILVLFKPFGSEYSSLVGLAPRYAYFTATSIQKGNNILEFHNKLSPIPISLQKRVEKYTQVVSCDEINITFTVKNTQSVDIDCVYKLQCDSGWMVLDDLISLLLKHIFTNIKDCLEVLGKIE